MRHALPAFAALLALPSAEIACSCSQIGFGGRG